MICCKFLMKFWFNMCLWKAIPWNEVGKLWCVCLFYFVCRVFNIINTFSSFCLLLNHCQAKTNEKISSIDKFVTILYYCKAFVLTYPIAVDNCGWIFSEYVDRFIWKCFEIFFTWWSNPWCWWGTVKNIISQSFGDDTAHDSRINHRVCNDFSVVSFCIDSCKLMCCITRDSCNIVIGIAVIIGVMWWFVYLLITIYIVDRFLNGAFGSCCVDLADICLLGLWHLRMFFLGFSALFVKVA